MLLQPSRRVKRNLFFNQLSALYLDSSITQKVLEPSRRFHRNLLLMQSSALYLDYAFAQKIHSLRAVFIKLSFPTKFQPSIGTHPSRQSTKTCANSKAQIKVKDLYYSLFIIS